MTKRINQVVAAEASAKAATAEKVTRLLRIISKPELFGGMSKIYKPLDENDESLPPEDKRVQARVSETIEQATEAWGDLLNLTLAKDCANCNAIASVVVEGVTVLENVPVVYLLFLEKRVHDFATIIGKLPVLDQAYDWNLDSQGLYRTEPVRTHRTRKVQEPLVLLQATAEHPGQAQIITKDVVVGHYETTHTSGAITHDVKRSMIRRCEKLLRAVKEAREKANMTEAPEKSAAGVLAYVFNDGAKETA